MVPIAAQTRYAPPRSGDGRGDVGGGHAHATSRPRRIFPKHFAKENGDTRRKTVTMSTTALVCRRCRTVFFAEYGFAGGTYCSAECECPSVVDPSDDDGFDGLPFDPDSGEHHCVFVRPGCDLGELPREWQYEARGLPTVLEEFVSRGLGFGRCVCGQSHTVLGRDDVRRLRSAGFVVEAVSNGDCSEFRYDDYYDYNDRDWSDDRSAAAYLRGEFDNDRCFEWFSADLRDELEVIESLGYAQPTGVREFIDDDASVRQPEPPIVLAPERYVVGVFEITRSSLFRWQLRHRFGGLAPCENGEHAKSAEYMGRVEAMDAARREMERLGLPVSA